MTFFRNVLLAMLTLVGALPAGAQDKPPDKTKHAPVLRRGASHGAPVSRQAATQLGSSFDAGDAYPAPAGQRKLLRLAGAIAVCANCESPAFQLQQIGRAHV